MATDKKKPIIKSPVAVGTAENLQPFTVAGAQQSVQVSTQDALRAAQTKATNAELIIDTAKVGSPEFKKATADLSATKKQIADLQAKSQQADQQAAAAKATQVAKDAQIKADDLKARADAGSAKAKADLAAAQKAATDAKTAADKVTADAKAKTTPTPTPVPTASSGSKTTPTPTPTPKPTPTPTAGKPLTPDEAQAQAEAKIASMGIDMGKYAVQMSLINSDPTLKELFYNDVYLPILNGKSPVDPAKFKADFQNTNWFKSYAEPAREAEAIKNGDKATWDLSVQAATDLINREATAAGYTITPQQASDLVEIALHKSGGKAEAITGLTLSDVQLQLKNIGKINTSGGQAATQVASLKSFAGDYGVGHLYGDAQMTQWADSIAKGTTTLAAVEKQIKDTAISSYSALAPQINAGLTVKSIVAPYTQLYGTTLEVDPNAQNLSDPTFANSMFMKDPKDPNTQVLKPLWQYQSDLKKDPRWAYTDNARQSLDTVAHSVLKDMGFKY